MINNFIYFDNASTTPLSENVLEAINNSYLNYWGNVSSSYKFGIDCSFQLESIRSKIAGKFNADLEDVIFTSGSSESISIVFNKISDYFEPDSITISKVEHNATNLMANNLRKKGWLINEWDVNSHGIVKLEQIKKFIKINTKLVSIIWGQSEIGSLQPIQIIGKECIKYGINFHVDATQIISNGLFNWKKLNCNLLSFSAHKFGGPKGVGILLTKKSSREILKNNDISLTHEFSIRQGTQPLPLISGIYSALENIEGKITFNKDKIIFNKNKIKFLKEYLFEKIKKNDHFQITGSPLNRLPNHLSFILLNKSYRPIEAYKIVNFMSDNNIAISSGSACSNSIDKPSKVLENIGIEKTKLFSNIRLSFNTYNKLNELDKFYELIIKCIDIF